MTELLFAEFEDETGETRRLTRDEVLIYLSVLSGAGNETTNRLIGWMGKVLAEEEEQRHELARDRSLVPNAIEELLRYEPPTPHVARYVTRPVEAYGEIVPDGQLDAVFSPDQQTVTSVSTPTPTGSTSVARSVSSTSRSAVGSTTASVQLSHASRVVSPSTRSCSASPTGRSTGKTQSGLPPPR